VIRVHSTAKFNINSSIFVSVRKRFASSSRMVKKLRRANSSMILLVLWLVDRYDFGRLLTVPAGRSDATEESERQQCDRCG